MNIIEKLGGRYDPRRIVARRNNPASTQDTTNTQLLVEAIYTEMTTVMGELSQLRVEDYDLELITETLISPIAEYLNRTKSPAFVRPIFVSGEPGIGKTTLLMILDETLHRLNMPGLGSCRELISSGSITGYFPDKDACTVAPLSLFEMPTAVLNARDWNNLLRCWTFDESTARESRAALADFADHLAGKVVIVDEAEIEGYVYFTEVLAQRGILVILTSNLGFDHIRLTADSFTSVTLYGPDHREGNIANVCLPNAPHAWFDHFTVLNITKPPIVAGAPLLSASMDDQHISHQIIYLDWHTLHKQPLLKDDFAQCFRQSQADFVLLDHVPFFDDVALEDVNLTFLGDLFRFVNFVDAIHDYHLALLVRGTQTQPLDPLTAGQHLRAPLSAYDIRTGSQQGAVAWIEWSRCLSRLRSREPLNAPFANLKLGPVL